LPKETWSIIINIFCTHLGVRNNNNNDDKNIDKLVRTKLLELVDFHMKSTFQPNNPICAQIVFY
jgi:hypothetical protein